MNSLLIFIIVTIYFNFYYILLNMYALWNEEFTIAASLLVLLILLMFGEFNIFNLSYFGLIWYLFLIFRLAMILNFKLILMINNINNFNNLFCYLMYFIILIISIFEWNLYLIKSCLYNIVLKYIKLTLNNDIIKEINKLITFINITYKKINIKHVS